MLLVLNNRSQVIKHYLNVFHFHKVDRSLNIKIHSEQLTSKHIADFTLNIAEEQSLSFKS